MPAPICPPHVALTGDDPRVIDAIAAVLSARAIATDGGDADRPDCATVHAGVVRRDDRLVVAIERGDGSPPVERVVDDATTAATVIESWARHDVDAPLLAVRPRRVATVTPPPPVAPATIDRTVAAPSPTRSTQLFAAVESSYATDHTVWAGLHVGASIGLGPLWVGIRILVDQVASAPASFGAFERSNKELLVGLDVPFAIGAATLTPGFAAGLGSMHTRVDSMDGADQHLGGETGGLRADVHATLSIPISARFSIDVAASGDLTQATHIETSTTIPPEPRGIARLSIGLRYGRP